MIWSDWHKNYRTSLTLLARLRIVRQQIRAAVDECAEGPIRIVSICAGDGRDVIEALSDHPRRGDVTAAMLDIDVESLERGRAAAREAGLDRQLHFICADATAAESYADIGPADVILISGVMGHVAEANIPHFMGSVPMLCKTGGFLVWSRGLVANRGAEHVRLIRDQLRGLGFEECRYESTARNGFVIGRARFGGETQPLDLRRRIFEFTGLDQLLERDETAGERTGGTSLAGSPRGEAEAPGSAIDLEQSLPAYFERQVMLHPQRKALGCGAWQLTYGELNHVANRIAFALLADGAPGDRVAVLMQHDSPLIAAMMAILKLGRTVVVLDLGEPPARLAQILSDTQPGVIVTDAMHQELSSQLAAGRSAVLCVDSFIAGEPAPNPQIPVSPDSVAFLIYTSGSTGAPKGVMQSHRSILHKSVRLAHAYFLQADDRVILLASLSRGQGVNTAWCALSHGAALCPFPIATRGVTGLADWMIAEGITIFVSAASIFRHFVMTLDDSMRFENVRLVWLASESATSEDFTKWQKHFSKSCRLLHTLSSSETGTIAQWVLMHDDMVPPGRLPVGRIVENLEVRLLDDAGREVPQGESGEISVRSRYLSTGYWRDDELTARHYSLPDNTDGARSYRGGDRGRMTADGLLVYLGREDSRVNIHGYRVELSEIEEALSREAAVERAVVCAVPRVNGDEQLVAYVVLRADFACTGDMLRQSLRGALPRHMVPATFVFLENFPQTPNGKIDRTKLEALCPATPSPAPAESPVTETEKVVAEIWSDAFAGQTMGRSSDFFDLGGDSLIAAVVAARIYARVNVALDLRAFAEHPTVEAMAAEIDRLRDSAPGDLLPPLLRVSRDEPLPLSYAQERIWKYCRRPEAVASYNGVSAWQVLGPLNVDALRRSMDWMLRRHEILRTTFPEVDGRPVQLIHPEQPACLEVIDLSGSPDAEEQARTFQSSLKGHVFDLSGLPLMRFWLLRINENLHWLLRATHHIILDNWSWEVYFDELGQIYEADIRGEAPPLPAFELLQYGDYAAWQRLALGMEGAAYRNAMAWWKDRFTGEGLSLELPFRRPEPQPDASPKDGVVKQSCRPEILRRLEELCRTEGATHFAVHLAALAALIAGETGRPEVVLGAYMTNRNRVEVQKMFGFFANLTSLRLRFDASLSFRQWLSEVSREVRETQARSEIPYEQLCEQLRIEGVTPPEIRAIFGMIHRTSEVRFGGVEIKYLGKTNRGMPWGFSFTLNPHINDNCTASFDARIYDPAGVRAFLDRYVQLLDFVSLHPDQPSGAMPPA